MLATLARALQQCRAGVGGVYRWVMYLIITEYHVQRLDFSAVNDLRCYT